MGEALEGPARRRRARHQVRHGHARRQRRRTTARAARAATSAGGRGQPAPPAAPTTSTSTSSTSPTRPDADRGDALGAHRPGARGQGGYLGCSNFAGWQVADADGPRGAPGLERFVCVQNRYSLLDRAIEDEVARPASTTAWASCRSSRSPPACSPASTAAARRRPTAPAPLSTPDTGSRTPTGTGWRPRSVRRGGRSSPPRRDRRPRRPARCRSVIAGATRRPGPSATRSPWLWVPTDDDLDELDGLTT